MKPKVAPRRKRKGNLESLKKIPGFKKSKKDLKNKHLTKRNKKTQDTPPSTVSSDSDYNDVNTSEFQISKSEQQEAMRRDRLLRGGFAPAITNENSFEEMNDSLDEKYFTPNATFDVNSDSSTSDEDLPEYGTSKNSFMTYSDSSFNVNSQMKSTESNFSDQKHVNKKRKCSILDKSPDCTKSSVSPIAFSCYKTGSIALILNHPMNVTVQGKMLIKAISGSVEVLGYTLEPNQEDFVHLYSVEFFGCLEIKTKSVEEKNTCHWKRVKESLDKCMPNQLDKVLSQCLDSSVILILKENDLSYPVDFACSLMPQVRLDVTGKLMYKNKEFGLCTDNEKAIQMSPEHEVVAETIKQVTMLKVTSDKPAPCVLIYGKRSTGKSTSLRYFVNKMLSNFEKVYYLDVDVGQPEFTPSGCVSLIEVTKPLLGPPFTHLKVPLKMAFYGSLTVDCVPTFSACVAKVVDFYKKNFSKLPLFINTFGWIQGVGLQCLNYIRSIASPMIEIGITIPEESQSVSDIRRKMEEILQIITRDKPCHMDFKIPSELFFIHDMANNKPIVRRDLMILSYFGRCQDYYSPMVPLNKIKPFCLRVEDVVLHTTQPVFEKHIFQAMTSSLVALCIVEDSQILENVEDKHDHKHLTPDADFSECVGFGFITTIDIERNLLYIITPEPYDVLKQVNTLVKGRGQLPATAFEKQEVVGKQLSYVRQVLSGRSLLSRDIQKISNVRD